MAIRHYLLRIGAYCPQLFGSYVTRAGDPPGSPPLAGPNRSAQDPSEAQQPAPKRPRPDDPPPMAGPLDASWVCIVLPLYHFCALLC